MSTPTKKIVEGGRWHSFKNKQKIKVGIMGSKEVLKMAEKKANRDRHRKYTSWEQMVSTSRKSIARANPVRAKTEAWGPCRKVAARCLTSLLNIK